MDLEKAYDSVNRNSLWEELRMYDVGGKLLNGIKSMYVNSVACIRIKGESECFRINSGMRQGYIMSPWLFNVYVDTVMKEVKIGMGRREVRFQEEGGEWRLPGLLYADDFVLCGMLEEDMRPVFGCLAEVCRRRCLKVYAGNSKVIV